MNIVKNIGDTRITLGHRDLSDSLHRLDPTGWRRRYLCAFLIVFVDLRDFFGELTVQRRVISKVASYCGIDTVKFTFNDSLRGLPASGQQYFPITFSQ